MTKPLKLYPPIEPFIVTQRFGEDLVCIDTETHTRSVAKEGACPPGYVSLYISQGMKGHNGLDLKAEDKQEVCAAISGKVTHISREPEREIGVEIVSNRRYLLGTDMHSYRIKTRYWHLAGYSVSVGERVKGGQIIGRAVNTGLSVGTHLHFEMKPVRRGLTGRFRNVFQNNGYFGAIDPEPYFND
jgi:murein DD-endopeptidase MepM/ murein hydrolase activator NlpD